MKITKEPISLMEEAVFSLEVGNLLSMNNDSILDFFEMMMPFNKELDESNAHVLKAETITDLTIMQESETNISELATEGLFLVWENISKLVVNEGRMEVGELTYSLDNNGLSGNSVRISISMPYKVL